MNNNIEVLLTMRDEASPTMNAFNQTVAATKTSVSGLGGTTANMGGLKETLLANKSAMRELGFGAMFLGSAMLGMGVAMQQSNNQAVKSAGNMLAMVGGIMMAVASAAQFVSAASKIAHALDAINIKLILQKALSGPWGWAMLAGAGAVAGFAAYSAANRSSQPVKIESKTTVVLDRKVVGEAAREEIISLQQRNGGTSGVR